MEHETFREMLARRAELWPIEEAELRAHLQGCPECRVLAEAYARQTFLLHSLPEAVPPPALRAGVLDAIRRQPAAPLPVWRRPLALVPLAAALLVAGIGLSTLHPLSGGHPSASSSATSVRATPKVMYEGQASKRDAHHSSSSPLRMPHRAGPHRRVRPTATASGYAFGGTVAQNPPASVAPPVAAPVVVPTPTALPAAIHVAAGVPPAGKQANTVGVVAKTSRKALPRHGPIVGGGEPAAPVAPPRQAAPPAPANPPTGPTPTVAPPPSPVPFTTPPAASYAPIRVTATVSATSTPPPTPAPFAVPYPGPQATPTPTP
jgi:hypothetical protein